MVTVLLRGRQVLTLGSFLTVARPTCVSLSLAKRTKMSFPVVDRGCPNTLDYRVFFKRQADGTPISPFHDIPLYSNADKSVYNMVVEVPRWTNAKMEIATGEPLNPIKQDMKKGKPRFVNNCFPYHGYLWNYGALPQTWEDPSHTDPNTKAKGDNDPIDVCEIGSKIGLQGEVKQVKVLGCLAMIDEGETDWKIFAIDVNDPLAAKMNDVADIEREMPGMLKATVNWFTIYKIPTGKPPNEFAFNKEAKNRAFAEDIIRQTHEQWQALISGKADKGSLDLSTVENGASPFKISAEAANEILSKSPAPGGPPGVVPQEVHNVYFVSA